MIQASPSLLWKSPLCQSWMCSSFRTFSRVWGTETICSQSLRLSLQADVLQHSSGLAARESQDPSAHREQALGAVGADSSYVVPQRSACCGPVTRGTCKPALQAGQPGSPQLTLGWYAPSSLGCCSQFVGSGGATGEGGAATGVHPCPQLPFPSLSAAVRWLQVCLGLGGRQAGLMGTRHWPYRDPRLAGGHDWSCAGTPEFPLLKNSRNTPGTSLPFLLCGGWASLHRCGTGDMQQREKASPMSSGPMQAVRWCMCKILGSSKPSGPIPQPSPTQAPLEKGWLYSPTIFGCANITKIIVLKSNQLLFNS